MGEQIKSFEDLRVYKEAFRHQQEIFELSKSFPADERYNLSGQIRRSSCSVGANIAETWQKRRYEAHFVSKLSDSDSDSDAELAETLHHLNTARAYDYIDETTYQTLRDANAHVGSMLGRKMNESHKWLLKS